MDLKRLMEAIGLTALIPELPAAPPMIQTGFAGVPRGGWPIRPYSRSKYRPHTANAGSREAERRRRQIEKGMLQVSAPWERKDIGRQVKPHRSGGGYNDYRLAG